jgi:transcriptional regulator GlxA family with amidase domain
MLLNATPRSITPPDSISCQPDYDYALLHARPTLDTITDPASKASRKMAAAGLPPRLFRRIQEYINTHLDSGLRNAELAASLGLSVSHFSRSFARSAGTTPHNYVIRLRLSRAQELLTETDLALTEIALTTGFADQSHFSRRFLHSVGLQPKAFRKRYRRDAVSNVMFGTEFLSGESK